MLLNIESILGLGGYDASTIEQYARPPVALYTKLLSRSATRDGKKAKASGAITDGILPISNHHLISVNFSLVGAKSLGSLFFAKHTDNPVFPIVHAGNAIKQASSRDLAHDYIHEIDYKNIGFYFLYIDSN